MKWFSVALLLTVLTVFGFPTLAVFVGAFFYMCMLLDDVLD